MSEHPSRASGLTASLLVSTLAADAHELELEGEAFHHLVRVRRLEVGERLQITDGRGRVAVAELAEISRRSARLTTSEARSFASPTPAVELLVAPPKPERAAWMVEKAVELGVHRIAFVLTRYSSRKGHPLDRWRRIAVSALEQSFGAWLPELSEPAPLTQAIASLQSQRRYLLDPEGASPAQATAFASATLAVGPEGGFDDQERQELADAGFIPLGLGSRILRVETAAIVGLGLVGLGLVPAEL
jgi:16S rRNA (uracil1498-N3)-methyltransferase